MENILKEGYQLEVVPYGTIIEGMDENQPRYESVILKILEEEMLDIKQPIYQDKNMIVHVGDRYDVYFFVQQKIYQCSVQVKKTFKEDGIFMVRVKCTNALVKYERRWHNRLKCHTKMRYLLITADNSQAFREAVQENRLLEMEDFKDGITLDVSGGGIRFHSKEQLPIEGMVITNFTLEDDGSEHVFLAKVLHSDPDEAQEGIFEQRLQYVDMKGKDRDKVVSYLYEKELEKKRKSK